ncbi:MAG: hypothetical protein F6K44_08010 [Moorea sp. SIO3E2]|uniref:hypothetical protein n=1 Tax=Moorena sp. SIO4E2 TaxID=2607826 RepID=UPI0013BCCF70|nr:hypothetical protein [Moorena sp. SIO4E2]NEQ05813.1 hypothetical protein [Moorena sp. SIO4E2]NEQ13809.1 hypothetical protein [Moorena sp. SIO3E2]
MLKINIDRENLIVRDFTELKVWAKAHLSICATRTRARSAVSGQRSVVSLFYSKARIALRARCANSNLANN